MDRLTATNRLNNGGRLLVENPQAADLDIPLTNSIIPQRGVGSLSFTRATIATVTDHEGVIRNCIAGEARFEGARRVRNLYTYSQDLSNSVWTAVSCAKQSNVTTAPNGTLTADRVQTNASTALMEMFQNLDVVSGKTYTYSAYVKYHNWRYIQLVGNGLAFGLGYINIDLQTGTITSTTAGAGNFSGTITSVGNGWYRVSATATCISTLAAQHLSIAFINNASDVRIAPAVGDGTSGYYIWGIQYEDVTGQSVQTVGEYISTNVLTTAPFHGANVDGVKYFNTTLSGATIPASTLKGYLAEGPRTNLFLQSEDFSSVSWYKNNGSVVANFALSPSGYTDADKFVPTAGTSQSYITQSVTVVASIYTISFYLKSAGKQFVQINAAGFISSGYVNFDIVNGVVGSSSLWSGYIEAVAGFPGMYRCSITTETVTAGTGYFSLSVVDSNSATRGATSVNNGSDSIIIWGAQFETGQNVSTYIPTTTTTVTRNTDVLTYDVRNAIANQGALSVVCSMNDNALFDRRAVALSSFTINRLHVQARAGGVPNISIVYGDGVTVRSVTGAAVGTNNIAVSWTNGVGLNLYMNNIKYIGAFVPSLVFSTIDVGVGALGYSLFGCIKNVRIWKTVPTDAELLSLSNQS